MEHLGEREMGGESRESLLGEWLELRAGWGQGGLLFAWMLGPQA